MKNIVLVGFMATGKTEVGKALAKRLNWEYKDTDELIIDKVGKSIPEIFKLEGEEFFRSQETILLEELVKLGLEKTVVATGGGIVLASDNWEWLSKLGRVICLKTKPEVILERVGTSQDRPLLLGSRAEVRRRIDELLISRQAAYAKADWTCDTSYSKASQVVEKILQSNPDLSESR